MENEININIKRLALVDIISAYNCLNAGNGKDKALKVLKYVFDEYVRAVGLTGKIKDLGE